MVRIATFVAALTLALGIAPPISMAQAEVPPDITWFGYDGSSMIADVAAQVLIQGGSRSEAADVIALLGNIGAPAPDTLKDIAALLQDSGLDEADTDLLISALLAVPGLTSADQVGDAPAAIETPSSTPSGPRPGESTHGETKATSDYKWILHGAQNVKIYFGHCNYFSGCETDGYIVSTFESNTYFHNDMNLYLEMRPGAGQDVTYSRHAVKMKRDINNSTDSTIHTYNCGTSNFRYMNCYNDQDVPNVVNNRYYLQQNFRMSFGSHTSDVQIQTRRVKVVVPNNVQFPAYRWGG